MNKLEKILKSDAPDSLKILKLQVLALRCMASSPRQKEVIAAYKALEAQSTRRAG
jgi:hypothetical protein